MTESTVDQTQASDPQPAETRAAEPDAETNDPISEAFAAAADLRGEAGAELAPHQVVGWLEAARARGDRAVRAAFEEVTSSLTAEIGEKRYGGAGTYATVRNVNETRLKSLEALVVAERQALEAVNRDTDLSDDGKKKSRGRVQSEFAARRERLNAETDAKVAELVSHRIKALSETLAQPRDAKPPDPVVESMNRVRDAFRSSALLQTFQPLDDRTVRALLVRLIESGSELVPAALEAAAIRFVTEPEALVPVLGHLEEVRGPRGTQRFRREKRLVRAGVELALLEQVKRQIALDTSVVTRNPGVADMVRANANRKS